MYENIEKYIQISRDEDLIARVSIYMDIDEVFHATIIDEGGRTLLDAQGNMFMHAMGDSVEEVMARLDELAKI